MKFRKYFKILSCFSAAAVTGVMGAYGATSKAYAEPKFEGDRSSWYQMVFDGVKLPSSVDVANGDAFKIPVGGLNADDSVSVYDAAGQKHTYVKGQAVDESFFSLDGNTLTVDVLHDGTYYVVFTKSGYSSNAFKVVVSNSSYSLDFVTNNGMNDLIPSEVKTGSKAIKLPSAKIKQNATDEFLKDGADKDILATVEVKKASSDSITVSDSESDIFFRKSGALYFNPKTAGTYTIKYSYSNVNMLPKVYTIEVSNDFVAPTELKESNKISLPSFELGDKDIELKRLALKDNLGNDLSSDDYNIESITITKKDNSLIKCVLTGNDLTFDMTKEAFNATSYVDMVGSYTFDYKVVDAYGNSKTFTYAVSNVNISTKPEIFMAYNYTETDVEKGTVNTDYSADFKSFYKYDEVIVPAAYATDKLGRDVEIVRILVDNDGDKYYIDNKTSTGVTIAEGEEGYNYSEDDNIGYVNKAVQFKFFNDEGKSETEINNIIDELGLKDKEFTLKYYAIVDKEGSLNGGEKSFSDKDYTFKITDATVEFDVSVSISDMEGKIIVDEGETVSVKVNASNNEDVTNKDARIRTAVFYYDGSEVANLKDNITTALQSAPKGNGLVNPLNSEAFITTMTANYAGIKPATLVDGKWEFTASSSDKMTILAVAIADDGKFDFVTKTIHVDKVVSDSVAPEIDTIKTNTDVLVNSSKFLSSAEVGDTIYLPTIAFKDTIDGTLSVGVSYYIDSPGIDGHVKDGYDLPEDFYIDNNVVYGGKIVAEKAGDYVVIYRASDDAGNTTIYTYKFTVDEVVSKSLKVNASGKGVTITNNTITATQGAKIKFDGILMSSDGKVDYTEDTKTNIEVQVNSESTGKENEYLFDRVGEYTATIKAYYDGDLVEEKTLSIKINAQAINWTNGFDGMDTAGKVNEEITLPNATTTDGSKVEVKVNLGSSTGTEIDVTYTNSGWKFTPTKEGVYYVTYSANSSNYEIADKTFKIKVGDNEKPVLTVANDSKLSKELVYNGTDKIEYKVKINSSDRSFTVTVTNDGKQVYSEDIKLTVTDRNDKQELENNTYSLWTKLKVELTSEKDIVEKGSSTNQFFIKGAGKCTLKISITDDFGNSTEYTKSFNVVNASDVEEKKDSVIGVVLIVVSIIVLVGIIVFFVLSGKKGGLKKSKLAKKVEDEVKNGTENKQEKNEVVTVAEVVETKEVEAENVETKEVETDVVETEEVKTQEDDKTDSE